MKNPFLVIIAVFFVAIIAFHIGNLYKVFFKGKLRPTKIPRTLLRVVIGLVGLLVSFYLFWSVFPGFSANKAYYKNPDYWHTYTHFRNDSVTKFFSPHFTGINAIYGGWLKIEEVHFNVEETPEGFKIDEGSPAMFEYLNDSILVAKGKFQGNTKTFHHYFGPQDKMIKIESLHSDEKWTYKFDKGRFYQYSHFSNDKIKERHTARYNGKYNFTIESSNSKGKVDEKVVYEHDLFGFPIQTTWIKEFEKPVELLGKEINKTVFEEFKIEEMSYQGEIQNSMTKDLRSDDEERIVYGIGKEILQKKIGDVVGKDHKSYMFEYKYDEVNNWYLSIRYKNNIADIIRLRKITYQSGQEIGSIDPEDYPELISKVKVVEKIKSQVIPVSEVNNQNENRALSTEELVLQKRNAETRRRAKTEAKRKADTEAKRRADVEAKKKAQDEARRRAESAIQNSKPVRNGLDGRKVLFSPRIKENSQKSGVVVLKVCVESSGKVISADYTQEGSTTADSQLIRLAIRNAKLWEFSPDSEKKQCGTVTFRFRVR